MTRTWATGFAGAVAAVLVVGVLPLAGAQPAPPVELAGSAEPAQVQDFDVWFATRDVRVGSAGCRDLPFTVHHDGDFVSQVTVGTEVWLGSRQVGTSNAYDEDPPTPLGSAYGWCPTDGLGTFRVGPAHVEWSYDIAAEELEEGEPDEEVPGDPDDPDGWDGWDDLEVGAFTDASTASFVVKQDQRATVRTARKAKGRMAVTARFRYFDVSARRWAHLPKGRAVTLQRRTRTGWKKVGSARVGAKGLVTVRGRAAAGTHTYRVLQKGDAATWSAQATVRR